MDGSIVNSKASLSHGQTVAKVGLGGKLGPKFAIAWVSMVVCSTKLDRIDMRELRGMCEQIGIEMMDGWSKRVTHLGAS